MIAWLMTAALSLSCLPVQAVFADEPESIQTGTALNEADQNQHAESGTSLLSETDTTAPAPAGQTNTDNTTVPESQQPSGPAESPETEGPDTALTETEAESGSLPETGDTASPGTEGSTPAESETLTESTEDESFDAPADENDLTRAFVARLYTTLLSRQPDEKGLNYLTNVLKSGTQTGADIVQGFLASKEFTGAHYSNEKFVELLYKGLFDRDPDENGRQGWLNVLSEGFSRTYVCAGFIGSDEYKKMCALYEIKPGQVALSEVTDLHPDVTHFVSYLYQYLLNRNPDKDGLKGWVSQLVKQANTASEVVYGFVYSKEFQGLNLSDEQYIRILYKTILGRDADGKGLNDWTVVLQNGMSRRYVLWGFLESQEFSKLCQKYGIIRGNLTVVENRDKNRPVTEYVNSAYSAAYGRKASADELNQWTGSLLSHNVTATDFLNTLLLSAPVNKLSTEDFIKAAYKACLMRSPSSAEIANCKKTAETSRTQFLSMITGSSEYANIISKLGIALKHEGWNTSSAGSYYVKNGNLLSGWQNIDGHRYYFDPSNYNLCATGWTYISGFKYYFNNSGHLVQNVDNIIGRQSEYRLTVNTSTNTVTVYAKDGANGFIIPVKAMICSTGTSGTPTIKGTYTLSQRYRWASLMGGVWGQWCTRISGGYLFHSTWYYSQNNRRLGVTEFNKLGNNASHGCVRLPAGDAKWIYDNCIGSKVTISTSCAQPLSKPGRPHAVQRGGQAWDPTDPTI